MPQHTHSATWQPVARVLGIFALVGLLVALFVTSLALGSVQIPFEQIVQVLLGGEAERAAWTNIVLKFRLPKAITAVLAGAGLSVSGLLMQTFFNNPLAGPFVLGVSSGASLGVAIVVLATGSITGTFIAGATFAADFTLASAAALGAGLSMIIVLLLAQRIQSRMTLLVLGLMFGYFTNAIVSLFLYFAVAERIQAYINWTFGSFGQTTWRQLQILAPIVLIGIGVAFVLSKPLNVLLLGENYAQSMGVNLRRTRNGILLSTALLTGSITAFCGPIGFIGIAVPHLCRALFRTSDHRTLIMSASLMGGVIALIAALIAEVPNSSITLPLNAITAFIGAPVVIAIILRSPTRRKAFDT